MPVNMKRAQGQDPSQLREHYQIEKRLASRLKSAPTEERRRLYGELYDELFRSVPHHPQLARKQVDEDDVRLGLLRSLEDLVSRFLDARMTFMEVGAGDCRLSLKIAPKVKQVYALDVSEQISHNEKVPGNFRLILSDGCTVPVEPGSVDLAFSHQLLEHLHPEDALVQLRNLREGLKPGGSYVCITPSRFSGPHDVSKFFDDEASGFHLKEYSTGEMVTLFKQAGFTRFQTFFWSKGVLLRMPVWPVLLCEAALSLLPRGLQRAIADRYPLSRLLGNFIAIR